MIEEEIAAGRRAFPMAQQLLAGATSRRIPGFVEVCWHGSERSPESGAFGLVSIDGGLDDLVGDIVKVTGPTGAFVFVYVLGQRDVTCPLSVSRRAFLGLGLLAQQPLSCIVEAV